MMIRLILFACALLTAQAAVKYIDFDGGDDSNSGDSTAAAWKYYPKTTGATGNSAAYTPASGDHFVFKGGVQYVGGIPVSANNLTFRATNTWGSGRWVHDSTNVTGTVFNMSPSSGVGDANRSGFVLLDAHIRNVGGYADNDPIHSMQCSDPMGANYTNVTSPRGGFGVRSAVGSKDFMISNCVFEAIGQWRNTQPFSGTGGVSGQGVNLQNPTNIIIADTEFTKMKVPLSFKCDTAEAVTNIYCTNVVIHDYINWGVDLAPQTSLAAGIFDVTFKNCKVYDMAQYDAGNWLGCGEKPHTDGFFFRTANFKTPWVRILVDGCEFWTDNAGASQGGTAAFFISDGPTVTVQNSIFRRWPGSNGHIRVGFQADAVSNQTVRIMHCYIEGFAELLSVGTNPTNYSRTRTTDIYNNIFAYPSTSENTANVQYGTNIKTFVNADGNVFWKWNFPSGSNSTAVVLFEKIDGSSIQRPLSTLKSQGFETNSWYGDPLMVDPTGSTYADVDYHLATNSPIIGIGVSTNLTGVTYDKDGNVRSEPPTPGPYEPAVAEPPGEPPPPEEGSGPPAKPIRHRKWYQLWRW